MPYANDLAYIMSDILQMPVNVSVLSLLYIFLNHKLCGFQNQPYLQFLLGDIKNSKDSKLDKL